jgi:hypothetical protein
VSTVRRAFALPALLALAALATAPSAARAAEDAGGVAALLRQVGAPAEPEAVRRLVRLEALRDAGAASRAVAALWHAGGHAAAAGLLHLARHSDPAVRRDALRGIAHLGLRPAGDPAAVRSALDDPDAGARAAAFEAVAVAGDARDVPSLLARAASSSPAERSLAFRALRGLTGERSIPYDAVRWADWWAMSQEDLEARLRAGLAAIEAGDDPSRTALGREHLDRHAWAALDLVTAHLRAWVQGEDPRLRREGLRAAAALRLGALADLVESALPWEQDPEVLPALADAAVALGVRRAGTSALVGGGPPP